MGTPNVGNNHDPKVISEAEWEIIGERLHIPQRQVQVIRAIMAGQGKPQAIAQALGIQPCSVKTHMERLYRTLDAHDRVDVVVRVFVEVLELRQRHEPY